MATAGEAPAADGVEPEIPGDASPVDVKSQVVYGVAWKAVSQIVVQLSRVAVGIILARLLTPSAFGLAAMALTFAAFLSIFTDLALGSSLIQKRNVTEADRSTAFWTTVAVGMAFTVIGIAMSGWVAHFFGQPEVQPLFAALAVGFTLNALSSTQNALLTRELAFRSLQLRQIFATLAGGVIGIALAVAGTGAWAIIGQSLGAAAVSIVVLWTASSWRPHLVYSWASLREIQGFGIKLFGAQLLSYFTLNGDNLLIGRFLGSAALGTYSVAYNLMFTPMSIIATPIHQVAFPALALMRDDQPRLVSAWLRGKRISSMLLAPAYTGLIVMAPDIVRVLFGTKWDGAIPIVQLLSLAGLTQAIGTLNWTVLMAVGKAGTYLWLNVLETIITVTAFAIGLQWGIVGVAALYALSKWPLVVMDTHYATRALSVRLWTALWAAIFPSFLLSALMGATVFALRLGMAEAGVPPWLRIVLLVPAAVVLYVGMWRLVAPQLFAEVKTLLPLRFAALRQRVRPAGRGAV